MPIQTSVDIVPHRAASPRTGERIGFSGADLMKVRADIPSAMQVGWPTTDGLGLSGTRRLMDEFAIEFVAVRRPVMAKKWLR